MAPQKPTKKSPNKPADKPGSAVAELLATLDLEQLEQNLYRGRSPQDGWQRVFGGQVLGQALTAAVRTVEPARIAHSMHAYFLLGGDPKHPIIYDVERIRDGSSFTTRRVKAIQHGRPIFTMSVSFHKPEEGYEHHAPMPKVPPPESLPSAAELMAQLVDKLPENMRTYWMRERPIDMRPVDISRFLGRGSQEPTQSIWMRAAGTLPDALEAASVRPGLCQRLHAARHRAHRPWQAAVRYRHPTCESRPRPLVSSPVPRRRLAALRPGQPQRPRRAWILPRQRIHPRRSAGRLGCAGRTGSAT